jgi:5-(carboxyamino)imidazole ribonucleotide synthase
MIAPGAMLGVLGGGQLGRMFVHAAQRLGYRVAVLDPDAASPAGACADLHLRAAYVDAAALDELALQCAAVTTEFENVPAAALERLAARGTRVAPQAASVAVCQQRAAEKALFASCGVPVVPHAAIDTLDQLEAAAATRADELLPGILKTAREGYDGKGQRAVGDAAELLAAWRAFGEAPCLLERRLELRLELSVIVARADDGRTVSLPLAQNLHRGGILALTQAPAPDVPDAVAGQAERHAAAIVQALGHVGVLCIEFFWTADGRLLANEMAPRPHNSGHYSIEACMPSQFELQVRTLAGLPLAAPRLQCGAAAMLNLLGDLWFDADGLARTPDWAALLDDPALALHLYGKHEPRRGRKMGHVTICGDDAAAVLAGVRRAAARLGLPDPLTA